MDRNRIICKKESYKRLVEKEHNGIVTREYYMTSNIKWMNQKEKWPGLKSIGLARNII